MPTMKPLICLLFVSLLTAGCARRSELQAAKAELEEAKKRIETLETQRVPRIEYDVTKASLRLADERIAGLEQELRAAREQLSAKEPFLAEVPSGQAGGGVPTSLSVARGTHEFSNGTFVFSSDAQLNFGRHLLITSPTGLLVTDPDQRVVGGDLSIEAKGMTMETADGLLTAESDGSVKFTGNTLTMKFGSAPADGANSTGAATAPAATEPSQEQGNGNPL